MSWGARGLAFLVIAALLGCSQSVQTTSGERYLRSHLGDAATGYVAAGSPEFGARLIEAASVEPRLTFPARIGLARVVNGRLTGVPEDEATIWLLLGETLGPSFGALVPISPLVAQLVAGGQQEIGCYDCREVVNEIRLGAARQHIDAVLVYEVHERMSSESNILAIANISVIGGFLLPTTNVTSETVVQAMLIDVMQGYPYGMAQARASNDTLTPTWGSRGYQHRNAASIRVQAVQNLSSEVDKMLKKLRLELAERRSVG